MENLLIMGINTRPMVNSALKLDYNTFSVSYFKTFDFINPFAEKHILHQEFINSDDSFNCGSFEDNYSPSKLLNLSEEYFDSIDKIIFSTGISADDFIGKFSKFKNKIKGNLKTDSVNDKFKFYNKLKNKFNVPFTFIPSDIYEAYDILKQYPNSSFILKPIKGSGGYGILLLNKDTLTNLNHNDFHHELFDGNYIMQEYISGVNLSSSVLSTKSESQNIINTRLLINNDLKINDNKSNNYKINNNTNKSDNYKINNSSNDFIYLGNILPLTVESFSKYNSHINISSDDNSKNFFKIEKIMEEVSEDLISYFNLIGSNGVDFVLSKNALNNNSIDINDLYPIEINPRFQGTYESCEKVLGINLLDAHIKACEGELVDIPKFDKSNFIYSVKKIEYAKFNLKVKNLKLDNVYDIPYPNVNIEKNQPIVTILSSNSNLDLAISNLNETSKKIKERVIIDD